MRRCLNCDFLFDGVGWQCPRCGVEPEGDPFRLFAPDAAHSGEGMERSVFETLARLEPTSFWFRGRNRLIVAMLERYFPRPERVLELGCGTGFVLAAIHERFPNASLTGGELFTEALAVARSRVPSAELVQVDGRDLPFVEEFDVAAAFDVLEHIREDEAVLQGIARAVRPGGGLIVTVPQHQALWSAVDDYSHHVRRYSRGELVAKLARAGFVIRRVTSFMSILLPAMVAARLPKRGKRVDEIDPFGDFRLPRVVDSTFDRLLSVERGLILRGISLPVGGSLLAVAERRASAV
jgi:SAM-dependent methyltransferase